MSPSRESHGFFGIDADIGRRACTSEMSTQLSEGELFFEVGRE